MTSVDTDPTTRLIVRSKERAQARDLLHATDGHADAVIGSLSSQERQVIPPELAAILGRVIEVMAQGGSVSVGSVPEILSTTTAAELLGVSRPTLVKMIERGEIDAHLVGTHRRLAREDVLAFRRARIERQRRAFEELRELEDSLPQD